MKVIEPSVEILKQEDFSIKGIKSTEFVNYMGKNNICISGKTSCCPIDAPSKLVYAKTKDKSLSSTSVRISLSHLTKQEEIEEFLKVLEKIQKELVNGKI